MNKDEKMKEISRLWQERSGMCTVLSGGVPRKYDVRNDARGMTQEKMVGQV